MSYYTGVTNDLDRRLAEHIEGANPNSYTFKRRPVELKFYEQFFGEIQAIEFEKQIKGWSRKKKEALIDQNWEKLIELSKSKNPKYHLK